MKKFIALLVATSFALAGAMGAAEAGSKKKVKPAVTANATNLTVVGVAAGGGGVIGGGLILSNSKATANTPGQSGYASAGGEVSGGGESSTSGGGGGGPTLRDGGDKGPKTTSSINFSGSGGTEASVN